MEKIKVLQVNKLYSPMIGGVEKVVKDIAEGLQDRVDVEVLACQARGRGRREVINGIEVTRTCSLGILFSMPISPTFPFHLRRKSREADILHYHVPFPLGDFTHLLVGDKSKKLVITYHSDIVKQAWMERFYGPVLNRFLQMADVILVTSPNLLRSSRYLQPHLHKCRVVPPP